MKNWFQYNLGPHSAVMEYLLNHTHTVTHNNYFVLYKYNYTVDTSSIVLLLIFKLKSSLNNDTLIALNFFYNP